MGSASFAVEGLLVALICPEDRNHILLPLKQRPSGIWDRVPVFIEEGQPMT